MDAMHAEDSARSLVVSVHVPKTGGLSFQELLGGIFPGRLLLDYDERPLAPAPAARLRNAWARARRVRSIRTLLRQGPVAVHGHFLARKYRSHFPDARYAAWFRDPVERLASHYYFWKRSPDFANPLCEQMHAERMDLVAFAQLDAMQNVHARFLDGLPVSELAFVGLTEDYAAGVDLFLRTFPAPDGGVETARRNANPDRVAEAYDLSVAARSAIESVNREDRRLYDEARRRADQLLAQPSVSCGA